MSLQSSVMEKTVASRNKIVGQLYERLEQLKELLKNQARRTKISRLVGDCIDVNSKVSARNEILISSNVEALVSDASASCNKVNDHCRFALDSARDYILLIKHSLLSLLVGILKSRQLRPNVLRCC